MLQKNIVEKIKTHFHCEYFFPSPKILPFMGVMWKNIEGADRPQMAI